MIYDCPIPPRERSWSRNRRESGECRINAIPQPGRVAMNRLLGGAILVLSITCYSVLPINAAPINHGRFLIDPSHTSFILSYGNPNPTTFDQDVFCDATVDCHGSI